METFFYCLINTGKSKHDFTEYFKERKSLIEFYKWVVEKREKIEVKHNSSCVIENMEFIEKKIIA